MHPAPITLEVLPAGYGDCLLVSCPVGDRTWRLLVDTGPDECYPQLKARLAQLPVESNGRRHIDLFIISHIDHDHIGGAALLLNDDSLKLSFGDIWFNAPPRPQMRSVAEGASLSRILGARDIALPWNEAFNGKPVATTGYSTFVELGTEAGGPRMTLLSPTPDRLADLWKIWERTLASLRSKESDLPEPAVPVTRGMGNLDLNALAAKVTATDRAAPNGSSIVILLEHQGASVLLGADGIPTVMLPALHSLARHRGLLGDTLELDVVKLCHHGSRANVTVDLIKALQAEHYIFSTNNAMFNHPNDEAVARVILHGRKGATLSFNYATERNRRWADADLQQTYGYGVRYPESDTSGLVFELPAK